MRYLLDTNIVIALFGGEGAVRERLSQAEEVFLCTTVLGELFFGALRSRGVAENTARVDELAASCTVLACGVDTARQYGRIKNDLSAKGAPSRRTTSGPLHSPASTACGW